MALFVSTGLRNSVLGGHVQMMFDAIPTMLNNVKAGQVRALGTTGEKRSALTPDLPTVAEREDIWALHLRDKLNGESAGVLDVTAPLLRRVAEDAPRRIEELRNSAELRDQALWCGVPGWAAAHWSRWCARA